MTQSRFTKLGKCSTYSDYIIIGIETELDHDLAIGGYRADKISCSCIIHLRPIGNNLATVDDMVHLDGDAPLGAVVKYFNTGKDTLIIVNASAVFLGSSDFLECLETQRLSIQRGSVKRSDIEWYGPGEEDTHQFIASCPPTIVQLEDNSNGKRYCVCDCANWGIRYIEDIYSKLRDGDKLCVPRLSDKPVYGERAQQTAALMARYFQEYFRVCRIHKLGPLRTTYSGQALARFRTHDYANQIITHTNPDAANLEASCYTLGRNEVRYKGLYKGECYLLDANSLYPFLALTRPFPQELLEYKESPHISTVEKWCDDSIVLMQARVRTDEPRYRCANGNHVSYPTGTFNTFLAADECVEAIKRGHCLSIYRASRYSCGDVLSPYAEHMLDARSICNSAGNVLASFIIKCITNGLFGKLSQSGNVWIICPEKTPIMHYGGYIELNRGDYQPTYYRVIAGEVSKLAPRYHCDNSFPAISACANAYSRSWIWSLIQLAGQSNVLYVGIDSLITTQEGYQRLLESKCIHPTEYGSIKIVSTAKSCFIHSQGVYRLGSTVKYQGVSRSKHRQTLKWWDWRGTGHLLASPTDHVYTYRAEHEDDWTARNELGVGVRKLGRFMEQVSIYQEPLEQWDKPIARVQGTFRFGEYER